MRADFCGVLKRGSLWGETNETFDGLKTLPVFFTRAKLIDGFEVCGGAVADMIFKSVFGEFGGELYHVGVSCLLGDDRSGADFLDEIVGFYYGCRIML